MEVLVVGGHGQVGLRLPRLLARDGHRGRGVTRTANQASDLAAADAETVLCDLERGEELRPHVGTADAIVFAAGAGGRYSFGLRPRATGTSWWRVYKASDMDTSGH